jgi:hypothetical protein
MKTILLIRYCYYNFYIYVCTLSILGLYMQLNKCYNKVHAIIILRNTIKNRLNYMQRPLVNPDKIMWPKIESGLIFPD